MVRTNYFRVFTTLVAMAAAAIVAVLVAYGSASAQSAQGCTNCGPGGEPPPGTPTVVSTKPADGAENVKTKVKIKAKFSEKMDKSSITTETVRLKEGPPDDPDTEPCDPTACEPLSYTVKYNKKKKQVTLTPSDELEPNTEYSVLIEGADDTDGLSVKDKSGNPLAEDYTWTFTTAPPPCDPRACEP